MSPFVETIRVEDGIIHNLAYNQQRLERTMNRFFPLAPPPDLQEELSKTQWPANGIWKVHIEYDAAGIRLVRKEAYHIRNIKMLRLAACDDIDYTYKSADRSPLARLLEQKGDADEIIIVKNGLLTDTSYSNIALYDGSHWVTPAQPLLKGTMRQSLIDQGLLAEKDLTANDLPNFEKISLINAMMPLERCVVTKII